MIVMTATRKYKIGLKTETKDWNQLLFIPHLHIPALYCTVKSFFNLQYILHAIMMNKTSRRYLIIIMDTYLYLRFLDLDLELERERE